MTLLARVATVLESLQVPHSLIGAAALAIYGVPRSTSDHDLFVTDIACLDRWTWEKLASEGVHVEIGCRTCRRRPTSSGGGFWERTPESESKA